MISPTPKLIELQPKRLMGLHAQLSYAHYAVAPMWQELMPKRKDLIGLKGAELFSVQYFSPDFFQKFSPMNTFDKWVAVEIEDDAVVPAGWVEFIIEGGLYAVFSYKGDQSGAQQAFQYIFGQWLPQSGYELDDRKHFEILDHRYKKDDINSEEDIYIPVRIK